MPCALGLDFGTLSGRALLADLQSGETLAVAAAAYSHGVMDTCLPGGRALPADWALQHPGDYVEVLEKIIPAVLNESGVAPQEIVGIGVDFTACTLIPTLANGTPLCFLEEYQNEPHAYAKLWKHHAAQPQANKMNEAAAAQNEPFLARCGGKISAEWAMPKAWQVLEEAPEIYEKTALFVEAADWLVWQLTGRLTRNACCAGYKNLWDKREGYPKNAFFKALDPRLDHVMETKFAGAVAPLGGCAGGLASKMAAKTGLRPGTAVAVPIIDAHAFVPAVGIAGPGALLAVMGTSTCHITLGHTPRPVRGICGVAEDGIYPGLFAYEAGQCCVGDHFQWATEQIVPQKYVERAQKEGISLHEFLAKKKKEPGASGLLALDWWNGNRSVLADGDLSGLLVGMGLKTTAADVYWALVEATAFGTRMIVENFCAQGLPVEAFFAAGGIAKKSPHMMQIYADVLNLPVRVGASLQAGALGAAIFGAVAGGAFANVFAAAERLGRVEDRPYDPSPASVTVYEKLYNEYKTLHDYFGRGGNGVMKRLRAIKNAPH